MQNAPGEQFCGSMVLFLSVLVVGVASPIPRTDLWCLSQPHSHFTSPCELTA